MNKFVKHLRSHSYPQLLLIVLFTGYSIVNLPVLNQDIRKIAGLRRVLDHNTIGYQFKGLEQFLAGQDYISYYTDGNLKDDRIHKLFAQGQYVLAPTILDPDNLNHEYILFVCKNELNAWKIINEQHLYPLLRGDRNGIILARRHP